MCQTYRPCLFCCFLPLDAAKASISFSPERRKSKKSIRLFSTHPPTPERIEHAQKEIAAILPNRPEYIVTTSEFDNVKERLRNITLARKAQDNGPGKPTLRTRTEQKQKGQTQETTDTTDDDRPTLKRRPDSP
jgi:beta-barrel assembly-enhancing protease